MGVSAQSTADVQWALGLHGSPGREAREEAELWSSQMLTGEEGEAKPAHTPEREQPVRKKKGAVSQRPGGERVVSERNNCSCLKVPWSALPVGGACWSTCHSGYTCLPRPWTGSCSGTAAMCFSRLYFWCRRQYLGHIKCSINNCWGDAGWVNGHLIFRRAGPVYSSAWCARCYHFQ